MRQKVSIFRIALFSLVVSALLSVFLIYGNQSASAFALGVTGRSGNPAHNEGATCSTCHQGGEQPSVVLIGPDEVSVGETVRYLLQISGGAAQTGGLNVSTTAGTLASLGADTQVLDGEITHLEPQPFSDDGILVFAFNWTAPATPSTVSMYGAGNSANGDFDRTGDAAAAASIGIRVVGSATPPPAGGDDGCVIPASGPWPPCATGGDSGDSGSCVIPPSGPWPPCATGEDARPPSTPDCEVPPSGPWPVCARTAFLQYNHFMR